MENLRAFYRLEHMAAPLQPPPLLAMMGGPVAKLFVADGRLPNAVIGGRGTKSKSRSAAGSRRAAAMQAEVLQRLYPLTLQDVFPGKSAGIYPLISRASSCGADAAKGTCGGASAQQQRRQPRAPALTLEQLKQRYIALALDGKAAYETRV